MNASTTVLNFLFPLITFPYVSRVLMPDGYGAAELALNTAQLFALIALLGVNTYGIRECAKVRDCETELARVFQELVVIIGSWTVVVMAAFYATVFFVPRFAESSSIFFVAGLLIPLSVLGLQWFMSATEQYAFMAVRNVVVKLIIVAAMFLFVKSETDVIVWIALSVLSTGLSSVANFFYIARNLKLQSWRSLNWKRHIKPLVIFFLLVAATTIYTMLDTIMLGYMTTNADVGYYNVAIKIKNILTSIIGALAAVLIPRATFYLAHAENDKYIKIVNLSVRAAVIYAFFVVPTGIVFADPIILILAGNQYAASVPVLIMVMPAVFFISFTQITSFEILTPQNCEKKITIVYAFAGLLDIGLNLLLIPSLHALGAAISTTLAECLIFIAHLVIIHKMEPLSPYVKGCLKILPCEIIAISVMMLGRVAFGGTFISAIVSIAISASVLLIGLKMIHEPLIEDAAASIKKIKDDKKNAENKT